MSCAKINFISLLESPAYCLLSIVILPSTLNSATYGHRNYFGYDELHYQGSPDKTLLEKKHEKFGRNVSGIRPAYYCLLSSLRLRLDNVVFWI